MQLHELDWKPYSHFFPELPETAEEDDKNWEAADLPIEGCRLWRNKHTDLFSFYFRDGAAPWSAQCDILVAQCVLHDLLVKEAA